MKKEDESHRVIINGAEYGPSPLAAAAEAAMERWRQNFYFNVMRGFACVPGMSTDQYHLDPQVLLLCGPRNPKIPAEPNE